VKNRAFKKSKIQVAKAQTVDEAFPMFRLEIQGCIGAIPLTVEQFLSLKEAFRDWINKEGYQGQ
jgi:hypothetical protein